MVLILRTLNSMQKVRCAWVVLLLLAAAADSVHAQRPESGLDEAGRLARRGAGLRLGAWAARISAPAAQRSISVEGYFQRGLDERLALENSLAVWSVQTIATQATGDIETRSYVLPALTSLKFYPFTRIADRAEPFVLAGAGFALGIEDEDELAIGGGGISLLTGFGFRGATGVELLVARSIGLSAAAKYQWIRFGEPLGTEKTFRGFGFEGGLNYRFQF